MTAELMSVTLDPLAFSVDVLALRGALIERADGSALTIVPVAVARELGVEEAITVAREPSTAEVGCGFGTVLLEKLIASMRCDVAACTARAELGAARPQRAQALASSFAPRNAVSDVLEVSVAETEYVCAWVSFVAEADDRLDGLVPIVFAAADGSVPEDSIAEAFDPAHGRLIDSGGAIGLPPRTAELIARRGERAIGTLCAAFAEGVARRHRRDHDRTGEYFTELVREARAPRRKLDPASVTAKIAHLEAEREAKLFDLRARYATRVSGSLAALIIARASEATARVRVRRRKASRELVLRLPAGAKELSKLACDSCSFTTSKPAFCDDALHVVCEVCLPNAQGRPDCPACA